MVQVIDPVGSGYVESMARVALVTGVLSMFAAAMLGGERGALLISMLAAFAIAAIATFLIQRRLIVKRANKIEEAAYYRKIDATGPQVLVIRGVDDEASLALAAGSIGSLLSSLALRLTATVISLVFIAWFLLNVVIGEELGDTLAIAISFCAVVALGFFILPSIFKSFCGREFLNNGFACEIASDSTPDTVSRVDAITLPPMKKATLLGRHYIYQHPDCVNEIVEWFEEHGRGIARP
jgi:hypothetical protein